MKRQSNQTDDAAHMTTMLCHTKSLSNARDLHEHQQIQSLVKWQLLVPFQTKGLLTTVNLGESLLKQTQNKSWCEASLSGSFHNCI